MSSSSVASSPMRPTSSCWRGRRSSVNEGWLGAARADPTAACISSPPPQARMRGWFFGTRRPYISPVVPPSPVFVTILIAGSLLGLRARRFDEVPEFGVFLEGGVFADGEVGPVQEILERVAAQ